MESKLNALLANLTVEYHKLQNQHWYVAGSDFFQAHAQLEELYDRRRCGTPAAARRKAHRLARRGPLRRRHL